MFNIALRYCSKEVRGGTRSFATTGRQVEHQRIIINERKPDISRNLALFYVWKDARVCSLKSFLSYAPQLSGVSIRCFYILSFLKAHIEKGCDC